MTETVTMNYVAKEQKELNDIEAKYREKTTEENAMDRIRRLDSQVVRRATSSALIVGIAGTLILGIGMCCCLVWDGLFALGIVVGIIGMAIAALAYPIYTRTYQSEKNKVAGEILELVGTIKK